MTIAPPRKIVLIGGSNTLKSDGWAQDLAALLPSEFSLENRAIGAATSLMGIYRLLERDDLPSGSIVIWEYALNESMHWRKGQHLRTLGAQFKWLIKLCQDRELCLLPVVMYTRQQASRKTPDPYTRQLARIIRRAGLPVLDCERLRKRGFGTVDQSELYEDRLHYRTGTAFLKQVARMVCRKLAQLRPVAAADPALLAGFTGRTLRLSQDVSGTSPVMFENSVISIRTWPFIHALSVRASGKLLGMIFLATRDGYGVKITTDQSAPILVSTQTPRKQPLTVLLKQVSLDDPTATADRSCHDQVWICRPEEHETTREVQHTLSWDRSLAARTASDAFVSLILEQPADRAMRAQAD